jgi:hypothetical protein
MAKTFSMSAMTWIMYFLVQKPTNSTERKKFANAKFRPIAMLGD